jgi:hypothetical protein
VAAILSRRTILREPEDDAECPLALDQQRDG